MQVSHATKKPRLIVTADDVGYCNCRTQGVYTCISSQGGLVTSGSLLVTPAFENGALHAIEVLGSAQNFSLGLHLNLTEGPPLLSNADSTLLQSGSAMLWDKYSLRERCDNGLVASQDVDAEVRAQIDRFVALVGRVPTHVDGHQVAFSLGGCLGNG